MIELAPILLEVCNESLRFGRLPPTFYQSSISLIHKKDKDPQDPSSYRLLSLLKVDMKILAKILAITPEKVLPTVIHEDQTGFMKIRQLFHNLRRLFNIRCFFFWMQKRPLTGSNGITSSRPCQSLDLVQFLFLGLGFLMSLSWPRYILIILDLDISL